MNAFILAGGQSSRMGRDKALLAWRGLSLIEAAIRKLRALGFQPRIAASRPDLACFAPIIEDNYPISGPLGGIESALAASDSELNLFLPVDLPLLPKAFLRWMINRAEQTQALATIPKLQGRPQPLCAIYNRNLLPYAQVALISGDPKVIRAIEYAAAETKMPIDAFDVEIIAATTAWSVEHPVHRWFHNLNTPADLEKASLEQTARIH